MSVSHTSRINRGATRRPRLFKRTNRRIIKSQRQKKNTDTNHMEAWTARARGENKQMTLFEKSDSRRAVIRHIATTSKRPPSARGMQKVLQSDGRQETHTTSNDWPYQAPVSRWCNDHGELPNDFRIQATPSPTSRPITGVRRGSRRQALNCRGRLQLQGDPVHSASP